MRLAGAAARHALVWPWRITTMLKFAVLVAVAAAETNSSAVLLDAKVCAYDRIRVNWTLTKPPSDPHIALYETTPVIGNEAPRPRAKILLTLPPLPPVDAVDVRYEGVVAGLYYDRTGMVLHSAIVHQCDFIQRGHGHSHHRNTM